MTGFASIKDHVFVLNIVPYRDSDLVVNFLSKENGKMSAVIYRGRKIGAASSFLYQPGDLIELEYDKNENRDFIKVLNTNGFKLLDLERFPYNRFLFHTYLIEIISKISRPELVSDELFDILLANNGLIWNEQTHLSFIVWVLWRLIQESGYQIDFSVCCQCQKNTWQFIDHKEPSFRKQSYQLEFETGRIICGNCLRSLASSDQISAAMVKILWLNEQAHLYSPEMDYLPKSVTGPLIKILNNYLLSRFEIKPRSLEPFVKMIHTSYSQSS